MCTRGGMNNVRRMGFVPQGYDHETIVNVCVTLFTMTLIANYE